MDRRAVVLAMLTTYGGEKSIREMARDCGIPERTFRRLMNSGAAQTAAANAATKEASLAHRERETNHKLPQQTPQQVPQAPKSRIAVPHQTPQGKKPKAPSIQESLFETAAPDAAAPPSSLSLGQEEETEKKTKKTVVPWRDRNPEELDLIGCAFCDFDRIHFEQTGRGAGGNWKKAGTLIRQALARGFDMEQLRRSAEHFHTLEGDWEAGHKIDTWAAGIDRYSELAKRAAATDRKPFYPSVDDMEKQDAEVLARLNDRGTHDTP